VFKKFIKILFHLVLIILLTLTTQVGGLIYFITLVIITTKSNLYRLKRLLCFLILYSTTTFLVLPVIAPYFGREPVVSSLAIKAHSFLYTLNNRNYVTPAVNDVLEKTAIHLQQKYPDIKIIHLDANFPFIDGFPLLPHLSHNDGKKIDITFVYEDTFGNVTNLKPARSGYGIYEIPNISETNQPDICLDKGYWQYDFPKYLTLGTVHSELKISEKVTSLLCEGFVKQKEVSKLFIEPHIKTRLKLFNNKVRFHGCQAVRHDDHIHIQVK